MDHSIQKKIITDTEEAILNLSLIGAVSFETLALACNHDVDALRKIYGSKEEFFLLVAKKNISAILADVNQDMANTCPTAFSYQNYVYKTLLSVLKSQHMKILKLSFFNLPATSSRPLIDKMTADVFSTLVTHTKKHYCFDFSKVNDLNKQLILSQLHNIIFPSDEKHTEASFVKNKSYLFVDFLLKKILH